jgi:hypothetical protein
MKQAIWLFSIVFVLSFAINAMDSLNVIIEKTPDSLMVGTVGYGLQDWALLTNTEDTTCEILTRIRSHEVFIKQNLGTGRKLPHASIAKLFEDYLKNPSNQTSFLSKTSALQEGNGVLIHIGINGPKVGRIANIEQFRTAYIGSKTNEELSKLFESQLVDYSD